MPSPYDAERLRAQFYQLAEKQETIRDEEQAYREYCNTDKLTEKHLSRYYKIINQIIQKEISKRFNDRSEIPFSELLTFYQKTGLAVVGLLDRVSGANSPLQQPDYYEIAKARYSCELQILFEMFPALNHPKIPQTSAARKIFAVNVLYKGAMAEQFRNWTAEGKIRVENGKPVALVLPLIEKSPQQDEVLDLSLPQLSGQQFDEDTTREAVPPVLEPLSDDDSDQETQLTPSTTNTSSRTNC